MALALSVPVTAQFTLRDSTGADVGSQFTVTTFASGLNWPLGMVELDDGSIAVAIVEGTSFFGSTAGHIVRLADTNNDGIADERDTLAANIGAGKLSALVRGGDLVFVTGQGSGHPILIYRLGANPTDALTLEGTITIGYPAGSWYHPHSGLGIRQTPDVSGSYDLLISAGSDSNATASARTLSLTSDIGVSGTMEDATVYMVTIVDDGSSVTGSNLTQAAQGLRNATGFDFHPITGDLYFQDNGIDGLVNANEPHSADELNVVPVDSLGVVSIDFGFPDNYIAYRTGTIVGAETQPLVAFQPLFPDTTVQLEGPQDVKFAPAGFPDDFSDGLFVGMHGKFSAGGTANEENPLVFVDLRDTTYFPFIDQSETGVGHLDGLLATDDELFIADISPDGGFGASDTDEGVIYRIVASSSAPTAPRFLNTDAVIAGGQVPAFDWDDVPGATSYTLVYADNSAFTDSITVTGLTGSNHTLSNSVADGTWYWRVFASNGSTTSAASSTASFTAIPLFDTIASLLLVGAMVWLLHRRTLRA